VGGWLTSEAHDAVKRRVKERFAALLAGAPLADDGGAYRAAALDMQAGGGGSGSDAAEAVPQLDPQAGAAAAAGPALAQADAELASSAQRQLRVATPAAGAAAAAAAAGGAAPQSILPTQLLEELRDYLAGVGEGQGEGDEGVRGGGGGEEEAEAEGGEEEEEDDDDEEGEEEEDGAGFMSDEGEQSEGTCTAPQPLWPPPPLRQHARLTLQAGLLAGCLTACCRRDNL
jgi:hypothetical protein